MAKATGFVLAFSSTSPSSSFQARFAINWHLKIFKNIAIHLLDDLLETQLTTQ